jgi:hypothetical protein
MDIALETVRCGGSATRSWRGGWCMQNTCMNFIVYWYIFLHIIMLLVVIIMFYNDIWGFSINPLILVITLHNMKTLFCVLLHFTNLPELKLTWDFSCVNRESPGAQEVNEMGHDGQTRLGGMGSWPGRATEARLSLEAPMSSTFVSWCSTWPKNTYINIPLMFRRGGSGETWNIKIEDIPAKIGCPSCP